MKAIVRMLAALLLMLALPIGAGAADSYNIAVLSPRGKAAAYERWLIHCSFLRQKTGKEFRIVPVGYDDVDKVLSGGTIDFAIINPTVYVGRKAKYGMQDLATMVNIDLAGNEIHMFGGVVIANAKDADINSFADVKGRTLYAVMRNSLGGYQAAAAEFRKAGIDVDTAAARVEFVNVQDDVVKRVLATPGSMGTLRTGILERMAHEKRIDLAALKIINQQKHPGFPLIISTDLYPEWVLAKLPKADAAVADEMAKAMMTMTKNDEAAKLAEIAGWTQPADYSKLLTAFPNIDQLQ